MTGRVSVPIIFLSLFLVAGPTLSGLSDAAQQPRGRVESVSGEVTALRGEDTLAVANGFAIEIGDDMRLGLGASCTGFAPGGEEFALMGPYRIVFSSSTEEDPVYAWTIRQIKNFVSGIQTHPLVTRAVRDWQYQTSAPMLLFPAPEGKVRAGESIFIWTTIDGIDQYEIFIATEDTEDDRKIEHTVDGFKVALDELEPGAKYLWKVSTRWGGLLLRSKWRFFMVMTKEEEKLLDAALDEMPDLEAGLLLLSAGLYQEAIYRFDAATAVDEDKESALFWRARAFKVIGLHEDAYYDLYEIVGLR